MTRSPHRLAALAVLSLVVGLVPAASRGAETSESWDAIFIGDSKVGHTHVKVAPVKDAKGRELVRVQVNTVLSFKRGADRVNMEVRYGTIETTEGSVLRLDTRTLAGQQEMRTKGDVIDGQMNLILEGGGKQQEMLVPWDKDVRGPYAAELTLARSAIKDGETREVKTFIPDLNRICTTRLAAKGLETITLGQGVKRELRRVEMSVLDGTGKVLPELDSTLWVDSGGQIIKTHTALLGGMDSYRTSKEGALATNGSFDLIAATMIRVAKKIPNSEKTRDVVYRVKVKDGDLASLLPADDRQSLKLGENAAVGTLEVRTATGTPAGSAESKPEYLRANPLINSDDILVVEHARKAVGNRTDPWEKAVAIQDWVFKNMKQKNFTTAFAPAQEVARNLEGDCSEHGVLTAAMCRAVGVPSRVAVGLIYVDSLGGFGGHLWNEVLINGRWVAIDATWNQTAVDATHIKLSDSSLDGVAPFEAFLPVLRVADRLTIDPVEIR